MQNFKNKLYNYEAPPPGDMWSKIAKELHQDEKVVKMTPSKTRSRLIFYGITAAASLTIILVSTLFFNNNSPVKSVANAPVTNENELINKKVKDSISLNYQILERIINTNPSDKKLLASNFNNNPKKYITIAGPEGQPVKISPKAATFILSADDEFPPKPVWNKKIEKWKQIMLSNTISPTATSLIDILQLAANSDNVE